MSGYNGTNGWNGNTGPAPTGGDTNNNVPALTPPNSASPNGGGNLAGPRGQLNFSPDPNDPVPQDATGNAPEYGQGGVNSATNIANELAGKGAAFQGRAVPGGYGNLYNQNVLGAQNSEAAARARELGDIDRLSFYAHGGGPSISGMQMGSALNAGLANDFAAGHGHAGMGAGIADASAHGAGAIGMGGHAGLQEAEEARGAYQGATGALRAGDLANQAGVQHFAGTQAQLDQAQAAENDRMQLQYTQMGQQALADQLQSETSVFDVHAGNTAMLAAQQYGNQAAMNQNLIGGGIGAGAGLTAAVANGEAGASTNPYDPGNQYGAGSGGWTDPGAFGINQPGYNAYSDRRLKDVGQPTLAEIMSQSWGQ